MADQRKSDGAAEREELLDELEENHERARREAAGPPEHVEETAEHDEKNPPHTTTGKVTSPKFGSAGSGGAEFEGPLKKN
ncbi:MAG TPA: hypothetical protein VFH14_13085 [Gemmatimonadaceae bacterium]|jgi:hypothetical protein|nr:hypothetical protein [Gemmatimonadaceae bacterium]